jgi:hypothetical protein
MIYRTLLVALVSVLAGCASSRQQLIDFEVIDGCVVRVKGISAEKAAQIDKGWTVRPECKVDFNSDLGQEVNDGKGK